MECSERGFPEDQGQTFRWVTWGRWVPSLNFSVLPVTWASVSVSGANYIRVQHSSWSPQASVNSGDFKSVTFGIQMAPLTFPVGSPLCSRGAPGGVTQTPEARVLLPAAP